MKTEHQNSEAQDAHPTFGERIFVKTAVMILVITALAKLMSASGEARGLGATDPLLTLSYRQVFLLVGLIELAVGAFLLFSPRDSLKVPVIAWLAANFAVYRVGLFWIGAKLPCGCLGVLTEALGIAPKTADLYMKGLLGYLLIGSGCILVMRWLGRKGHSNSLIAETVPLNQPEPESKGTGA